MQTSKVILVTLLFFLKSGSALAEESFSIFAGSGLSHSRLNYGSNQEPRFIDNAFVMGAEYSYRPESLPISFNGSFLTNDSGFVGVGLHIGNIRITGRIGLGLKNSETGENPPSEPTNQNYGVLYGLGTEVRINSTLGLSINKNSNATVGGLVFYW